MAETIPVAPGRRRLERRTDPTLAELTLPVLRRMMVTTMMFVIVLVLFLWMVRTVIIAAILGVIVASFTRPIYLWLFRKVPSKVVAATLTLMLLIVPVAALTAYSYEEVADVVGYIDTHQDEIATRIDASLHKFPFLQGASTGTAVRRYIIAASNYGTDVLSGLREAVTSLAIAATIFVFTVYYVLADATEYSVYLEPDSSALWRALDRTGVERARRCTARSV
jgi:predicted PurR-regulated permease PerM